MEVFAGVYHAMILEERNHMTSVDPAPGDTILEVHGVLLGLAAQHFQKLVKNSRFTKFGFHKITFHSFKNETFARPTLYSSVREEIYEPENLGANISNPTQDPRKRSSMPLCISWIQKEDTKDFLAKANPGYLFYGQYTTLSIRTMKVTILFCSYSSLIHWQTQKNGTCH